VKNAFTIASKELRGYFVSPIGYVVLTGFLLLVTLVAGISFGGVRYLAKKFLPWAVFDRPSQMEIIRLNLSDR